MRARRVQGIGGIVCCLLAAWLLVCPHVRAQPPPVVTALISQEIRPYLLAVEGLEASLPYPVRRVYLDGPQGRTLRAVEEAVRAGAVCVAVGPESVRMVEQTADPPPVVAVMVLDLPAGPGGSCGVSLRIPLETQAGLLRETFPGLRRLGVLFDPGSDPSWFDRCRAASAAGPVEVVPLPVHGSRGPSRLFEGPGPDVDALLFVPDPAVVSKTVIRYVITQCVVRKILPVGYNSFFHEAGAGASFVLDYRRAGEAAASLVDHRLRGRPCPPVTPPFRLWVKKKTVQAVGMELGEPVPSCVEERP
ncbi:MAG: hypothetical protein H5U10_03690 [Desulfacinum sp.]|nr:hypothetical protein [Desulfacinum sp.]